MHVALAVTKAPAAPFYLPRSWEAVSIGAASFLGYLALAYLLGEGRGTIAGAFLCAFGLAVRIGLPLRGKVWFRAAMLVLAALHLFVVAAFSWSDAAQWTGLMIMPFGAADTALVLVVIFLIYRLIYGAPVRLFTEPEPDYAEDAK